LTVVAAWYFLSRSTGPWTVERITGAGKITIDRVAIAATGRIGEGELLETDGSAWARIDVGLIGHVDLEPNTRLEVIKALPQEHRLSLKRGRLHAVIKAPPKLFFVNTPSAVVTDLGCAYTLEVDEFGNGRLSVTSGSVELELFGVKSTVPAEAGCNTRIGIGPGTPFFEDSSAEFQDALARFDFERESEADRSATLNTVLAISRRRDSLTLWNLLVRLTGHERELVYDRLAELVPPPPGVTRAGALSLDEKMLKEWFFDVTTSWFN
jgi:hypothetical protein